MSVAIAASSAGTSNKGKTVTASITGSTASVAHTVAITYPDGSVRTQVVTADGAGALSVVYPVTQVGTYTVASTPVATTTTTTHTGI